MGGTAARYASEIRADAFCPVEPGQELRWISDDEEEEEEELLLRRKTRNSEQQPLTKEPKLEGDCSAYINENAKLQQSSIHEQQAQGTTIINKPRPNLALNPPPTDTHATTWPSATLRQKMLGEKYIIIGEAYVHGVMDGEIVEDMSKANVQDIIFV